LSDHLLWGLLFHLEISCYLPSGRSMKRSQPKGMTACATQRQVRVCSDLNRHYALERSCSTAESGFVHWIWTTLGLIDVRTLAYSLKLNNSKGKDHGHDAVDVSRITKSILMQYVDFISIFCTISCPARTTKKTQTIEYRIIPCRIVQNHL
jgi:hypothetical protein